MEDLEEDKLYYVKLNNGEVNKLFYTRNNYDIYCFADSNSNYFYNDESDEGVDYVIMEVPSYKEVTKLKEDINTLKNIILKLSPSHRKYLEKNFKD